MPFSIGVGDAIAVTDLVVKITNSLRDAGGARSEYEGLLRELHCLEKTLVHLNRLPCHHLANRQILDSIRFTALSCQQPLSQFLNRISKYEDALGVYSKQGQVQASTKKLQWSLSMKEEVTKLQGYLSVQLGTINTLLALHGFETSDASQRRTEEFQNHVTGTLGAMQSHISLIQDDMAAQRQLVRANNSMLSQLHLFICGEVKTGWKSLWNMVSTLCVTTQQIYGVVLEIKSNLRGPETGWTFFQMPFQVEDALGRRFPIPSEYDFLMMDAVIKARFDQGPGSRDVKLGNYELFPSQNSGQSISATTFLRPGIKITMAILLDQFNSNASGESCPMPSCRSPQTTKVLGGGRICCDCNAWFDQSNRTRNKGADTSKELGAGQTAQDGLLGDDVYQSDNGRSGAGSDTAMRSQPVDTEIASFKNVRFSQAEGIQLQALPDQPLQSQRMQTPQIRRPTQLQQNQMHDSFMTQDEINWQMDQLGAQLSLGIITTEVYQAELPRLRRQQLGIQAKEKEPHAVSQQQRAATATRVRYQGNIQNAGIFVPRSSSSSRTKYWSITNYSSARSRPSGGKSLSSSTSKYLYSSSSRSNGYSR